MRERWETPDQDFIDVDWLEHEHGMCAEASRESLSPSSSSSPSMAMEDSATAPSVLCVLFHGLEGSSRSHYARAWADQARRRGWGLAVPHFRGCSGEINRAPRAYHSGDYEEIGWILKRMRQRHVGRVLAVGVSLGGNALMRWAQEAGATARDSVQAVCSVGSPLDLTASGHAIGRGFNRWVYTPMFLRTMKPRALAKLAQYPGLFDREALLQARDLYDFDNLFTAPLHGFVDTDDYWRRASSAPHFHHLRIPALVLNALNDPFVPAASLPGVQDVSADVTLWRPAQGGHVGFAEGGFPGDVRGLPCAIAEWFEAL
jgi:predicted alpha/beta-fold hydrolase